MRISIESTLLADPNLAKGRMGPSGLSLNGQQIVEEAQFFLAAAATFFARENAGTVLQFSVERLFSTVGAAEVFILTHQGNLPRRGTVSAVCGLGESEFSAEFGGEEFRGQAVFLRNAVLESAVITKYEGAAVTVQYTIKGGLWTTDVPPEVPGETEDAEDFIVMRRGKVPVGSGEHTIAVAFSAPLSGVPVVKADIIGPTGSDAIGGHVLLDTITNAGFTYKADAATPNDDYELHYIAVE